MNKLIVLEGLDGAGKSTQIQLLQDLLTKRNIEYRYMHFPQTDPPKGLYGQMVANFLKGEYGDVNNVHPSLVSLLYAGDREHAKTTIQGWLDNGFTVILDRYVYSNMAFQAAKVRDKNEKLELCKWLHHLEFEYNGIPQPTLSIFLHMPFSFISRKLTDARNGDSRNYLDGKTDIHESSLDLQKQVEQEYLRLVEENGDFHLVDCMTRDGEPMAPENIHEKVVEVLGRNGLL